MKVKCSTLVVFAIRMKSDLKMNLYLKESQSWHRKMIKMPTEYNTNSFKCFKTNRVQSNIFTRNYNIITTEAILYIYFRIYGILLGRIRRKTY